MVSSHSWHVHFSGQTYGPYSSTQMQAFVEEGRVVETSLITHQLDRGFYRASAYPVFKTWSEANAQSQPVEQASAMKVAVGQSHKAAPLQSRGPAVFLIMAEIRSGQTMRFLQTLQSHGKAQRIGDTVWLLKATSSVDILRRSLSQDLSKQDRLFILDSFKNDKAWFNIGADMDQRIRDLWEIEPGAQL